jgi:hypothetical protein
MDYVDLHIDLKIQLLREIGRHRYEYQKYEQSSRLLAQFQLVARQRICYPDPITSLASLVRPI